MEDKKLVRIGFSAKERSLHKFQGDGIAGKGSFNFPVNRTEREFLNRLSRATGVHGNVLLTVQDIDEGQS